MKKLKKYEYFNVYILPFINSKIKKVTLGYLDRNTDCLDLTSKYVDTDLTEISDLTTIEIEFEKGSLFYLTPNDASYLWGCENSVTLVDINGDFNDLIGSEIIIAEERNKEIRDCENYIHEGYTFYTFRTQKGSLDLRFDGQSNGYYGVLAECYEKDDFKDYKYFVKCKIFE